MKEKEKVAKAVTPEASEREVELRKEKENLVNDNVKLLNLPMHGKRVTADLHIQLFETQRILLRLQSNWIKLQGSYDKVKAKLKSETRSKVALRLMIQHLREISERRVRQTTGGQSSQKPLEEEVEDVSSVPAPEPAPVSCEHTNELPAAPGQKKKYPSRLTRIVRLFASSRKHLKSGEESDSN
ncbi:unnamed protein product [Pleuronectes platessa]|uniref:Uncharacterized protein n=1 Tax=Pleuronectes platessa TaxID=8262 RepID=A0A9N7VX71_PLEPL|nr:unnamed protein product [Pleuronectes platessa]